MKVAILDPVGGHGGMDYYNYGLARGLAGDGCEVYYFTCNKTEQKDMNGVKTLKLFGNVWSRGKIGRGFYYVLGFMNSFFAAKRKQVKILHFHFFNFGKVNRWVLYIAKKIFRFKCILTVHDAESLRSTSSKKINRNIAAIADMLIVHNHFSRDYLISEGIGESNIRVIPHGHYLSYVKSEPSKKNNGVFRLLFFGQIKRSKGLEILLRAVKCVIASGYDINLTIAGKPSHVEGEKYLQMIDEQGIQKNVQTRFEFIPNDEVHALFNHTDVTILPYKKIFQSGVLLHSMSYGNPVIASNLKPFLEVIEHKKTGLLFQSESAENLCETIIYAINHPQNLRDISERAMSLLKKNYNWEQIGVETNKVYHRVLKKTVDKVEAR